MNKKRTCLPFWLLNSFISRWNYCIYYTSVLSNEYYLYQDSYNLLYAWISIWPDHFKWWYVLVCVMYVWRWWWCWWEFLHCTHFMLSRQWMEKSRVLDYKAKNSNKRTKRKWGSGFQWFFFSSFHWMTE